MKDYDGPSGQHPIGNNGPYKLGRRAPAGQHNVQTDLVSTPASNGNRFAAETRGLRVRLLYGRPRNNCLR